MVRIGAFFDEIRKGGNSLFIVNTATKIKVDDRKR